MLWASRKEGRRINSTREISNRLEVISSDEVYNTPSLSKINVERLFSSGIINTLSGCNDGELLSTSQRNLETEELNGSGHSSETMLNAYLVSYQSIVAFRVLIYQFCGSHWRCASLV